MKIYLAISLAALAMAGCAQTAKPKLVATQAPSVVTTTQPVGPVATLRERQARAIELLGSGDSLGARKELSTILAEQPKNPTARKLLDQIDRDPRELFGARSYPYKVGRGDTMSVLASRLLGDSLLFYGLARYNNIQDPSTMVVGQTLLIPGAPRKVSPVKATTPAVAAAQRDPKKAAQLRARGLEQMNRGQVSSAVAVFRQALIHDPANPAIQRDLDRANRIAASVRTGS